MKSSPHSLVISSLLKNSTYKGWTKSAPNRHLARSASINSLLALAASLRSITRKNMNKSVRATFKKKLLFLNSRNNNVSQ